MIIVTPGPATLPNTPDPVLTSAHLHAKITDLTTTNTLTQHYLNASPTNPLQDCSYTFPLYASAAVISFTASTSTRTIKGLLQPKEKAQETYTAAKKAGKTAALLDSNAPDIWTVAVGNIPPNDTLKIVIEYIHELKVEDGEAVLVVPTEVAPRYGTPPEGMATAGAAGNEGMEIVVDANMAGRVLSVESPSHPIRLALGGANSAHIVLPLGTSGLGRDFVVRVKAEDIETARAVAGAAGEEDGETSMLVSLVPVFPPTPAAETPEIVFIVDRSGSMDGNRIEAVKAAMLVFLASLPQGVAFNICSFGSHHSFLFPTSATYSAETLDTARKHVREIDANYGGTEMLPPIRDTVKRRLAGRNLEVLFLTDGEIFDSDSELLSSIEASAVGGDVRVFALGIGETVTHTTVEGIARAGRGYSQTVQPGERCNAKVLRMLKSALTPHINDWNITWPGREALEASTSNPISPNVLQAPTRIPALFPGSRSSLYFSLRGPVPDSVELVGNNGQLRFPIRVVKLSTPAPTFARICGYHFLRDLQEKRYPPFVAKLVGDGEGEAKMIEKIGTDAALRFGLASKWTSFVAVDETDAVVPVEIRPPPPPQTRYYSAGFSSYASVGSAPLFSCASPGYSPTSPSYSVTSSIHSVQRSVSLAPKMMKAKRSSPVPVAAGETLTSSAAPVIIDHDELAEIIEKVEEKEMVVEEDEEDEDMGFGCFDSSPVVYAVSYSARRDKS